MTALRLDAIPGYIVHELLESSLVTSTYLASRAADGYPVMLEILNDVPASLEAVERFRTTVEAVAAIRHPVIPTIREIGEAEDRLYVVSSAVEGRALATALRDGRPLPLSDALAVCTELADALDMLNASGVVHGAVNPLTVWLNDRSRAPSAPFVSMRGHGTGLPDIDLSAIGGLSPPDDLRYLAPEQLRGEPASERTDQYALACLTLHCLAGAPPFDQPTVDALVRAHLLAPPDDRELHADELGSQIAAGLRRALAKDPGKRYPNSLALAEAIGGGAGRSWSWMVDDADAAPQVHRGIDITDDGGPAAPPGGRPAHADDRVAWSDGRQATGDGLTGRSPKDADLLPGSATSTGPQPPVRPDPRVATAGTAPRRLWRDRLLRSGQARWALAAALVVLVAVAAVLIGRRLMTPGSQAADGGAAGATTEIQASWREQISPDTPLSHLAPLEEELVAVVGDQLLDLDPATAQERWRTALDGDITGLSTLGDTIIAHTSGGFVGVDRTSGAVQWRSADTELPELAAVVTGRGRLFGVSEAADGTATVHAVDPHTGEIGWSIEGRNDDAGDGPVAVAFDASEPGQRTLYVMQGDVVTAFDTTTRQPRWQVAVEDARPATLTTVAGAVLVVTGDGSLCRYGAEAGQPVWNACASLQRQDPDARIVSVRDSRVIVAGSHEVMSVDFTSGRPQWRVTPERALQPVVTTNPTATYIAAPDGTIEAISQRDGASLWETSPFGTVTAMTATDEAVFVATEDGRLTRLETAADTGP